MASTLFIMTLLLGIVIGYTKGLDVGITSAIEHGIITCKERMKH